MRAVEKSLFAGILLFAPSVLAQAPAEPAPAPAPAEAAPAPEATTTSADPAAEAAADVGMTASPEPGAEAQLSAAELEALGFATSEGGEVSTLDTDLHVSGFMDFNFSRLIAKKDQLQKGYLPDKSNFYMGNINVYFTKNLSEKWRTMAEVRFSYAPNGSLPMPGGTDGTPQTAVADYADFDRLSMKWGAIEIERAYLDYTPWRFLTIRAGSFLTPYGIWNVDHGSPTFIPVQRPYVIGQGLIPERQTGFELFGRWEATANGTLGYHLTLSNGTGPITDYRDLDENKAIGGRLYWEQRGFGELKIGGSIYYGQETDAINSIGVNSSGKFVPVETVHLQYNMFSLAADAVWKYKGLVLQAEYISQQRNYSDKGREGTVNQLAGGTVFPADVTNWGTYGLVAYRLPWVPIMPYVIVNNLHLNSQDGTLARTIGWNIGLNIRPIDAVVLKLEYLESYPQEAILGGKDPFRFIQAQAAWAF